MATKSLAALRYCWTWWARPKQLLPDDDRWHCFGFCTGRGFGKTRAIAEHVQVEVQDGRATAIALISQGESECVGFMVNGDTGLVSTSPPWFKAEFHPGSGEKPGFVVWPNGAMAFIYTPNRPGSIRGHNHDLGWASEKVAWPTTTRDEAWMNLVFSVRIGYARIVWDTTPKRRHPMIRRLIKDAQDDPEANRIVNGSTYENSSNLAGHVLATLEKAYGGTQAGREELEGVYSDDDEGALWKQAWIDDNRRNAPATLKRRILIVDSAITVRKGSDDTGVSELGLGIDDQVFVFGDYTGKHRPEEWGDLVLARYEAGKCDCVVVETNRGGNLIAANIRARGQSPDRVLTGRQVQVEVVDSRAKTRHVPGIVYVKEVHARGSKADRAGPVASTYEAGRVSHVRGANLDELEALLTSWVPDPKHDSPDRMDPLVWGVLELLQLSADKPKPDGKAAFRGFRQAMEEIARPATSKPIPTFGGHGGDGWGNSL